MENKAYLGIDVAKGSADFLLVSATKETLEKGFVLDDCRQGWQMLHRLIDSWFARGITHLYCGIESTGGYENNWFTLLCSLAGTYQKGHKTLRVVRVNPRPVRACGQAAMLPARTDQTSALAIASYLIGFPEKIRYSPHPDRPDDPRWRAPLKAFLWTKPKACLSGCMPASRPWFAIRSKPPPGKSSTFKPRLTANRPT